MVSIVAFQAVDPGSIPGHRRFFFFVRFLRPGFQDRNGKKKKTISYINTALQFKFKLQM